MGDEGIDRRQFIQRTALGLITAGLGIPTVRASSAETGKSSKILYRTLGNTKLQIPVVSFGVMNSDSPDLIRKALDMGVKHLDTAHVYLRGNSEKVIGQILEQRKNSLDPRHPNLAFTRVLLARLLLLQEKDLERAENLLKEVYQLLDTNALTPAERKQEITDLLEQVRGKRNALLEASSGS